jgi:hypothetical protein
MEVLLEGGKAQAAFLRSPENKPGAKVSCADPLEIQGFSRLLLIPSIAEFKTPWARERASSNWAQSSK